MIFKAGVILTLQPDMARALPAIDRAHLEAEIDRGAVITSANDSKHMATSLHYKGLAVDIRTRDLHEQTIYALSSLLRELLNGDPNHNRPYQVVLESDHVHIEYQPA